MTHIRTKALGLLIGLAAILTPASSLFAQEDAQSRFDQGMAAYHAGDHETALGHFRSVVSAMPDSVVAVELLHSSQDGILELLVAGGEFETFAREVLATAATMTNDVIRDSAAAEADAKGCFAESYETRARAIFALSSKYGPFAAPPLVAKLASPSEEIRLQAVYALSRLGTEAVLPTLAASHSSHVEVRMGALMVMAEIKDGRVAARVADMAENDTDGAVRSIAGQLGYTERAVDLHYAQAWNYILADEMLGLSPAENYGVLWSIDSSRLQSYSVPTSAMALELAKYHLIRADELGHPKAMSSLAVVYANEAALLQGLVNDGQDYQEVLAAQRNAALTISGADRDIAMQGALQHGMQAASIELASMLG
ncbi:MAG: HEAT repeat domain-containing protein, partial [Planctomycetes bacterium]|nr:HEAT repeat domain-containing protein [Planctomycetota bacterium]